MNDFLIKIILLFITLVSLIIIISYTFYKIIQRKHVLLKIQKDRNFKEIQNERLRISGEIHDITSIATFKLKDVLENKINQSNSDLTKNLIEIVENLNQEIVIATEKIFPRGLIFKNWNCAVMELCELLCKFTIVDCVIDNAINLSESKAHECYRILQEHLTNIIKHVNPKYIQIFIFNSNNFVNIEIIYPNEINILEKKTHFKNENSGKGLYYLSQRYKTIKAKTNIMVKDTIVTETIKFPIL